MRYSIEDKKQIAKLQHQTNLIGEFTCKNCGRTIPIDLLEVDHIRPLSKGGTEKFTNLQLLCASCNRKKGNKMPARAKKKSECKSILPWVVG